MTINQSIFKAYDIRGIYPSDLNEALITKIGQAFAQLLISENPEKELTVVVSRDMRLSSDSLREAVVTGITSMGVKVIDIGLASTPTFYFAVGYLKANGGLQVSASHNPAEYNGCKMTRAKGYPISGDDGMYEIRDMVVANEFQTSAEIGTVSQRDDILDILFQEQSKHTKD